VKSRDVHWWTSSFLDRLQSLPTAAERKTGNAQEALERMKAAPRLHLLLDYDGIAYDEALSRPDERRWELKALLTF